VKREHDLTIGLKVAREVGESRTTSSGISVRHRPQGDELRAAPRSTHVTAQLALSPNRDVDDLRPRLSHEIRRAVVGVDRSSTLGRQGAAIAYYVARRCAHGAWHFRDRE